MLGLLVILYLSLSLSLRVSLSLSSPLVHPPSSYSTSLSHIIFKNMAHVGSFNHFIIVFVFVFVFVFAFVCVIVRGCISSISAPITCTGKDIYPYTSTEREWTSLLSKAISLPINCKILKLFPEGVATDQTTPRRTFPV